MNALPKEITRRDLETKFRELQGEVTSAGDSAKSYALVVGAVAAVAPLGPADQQRLLQAEGPDERLRLLDMLLTEENDYLAARLQMG